MAGLMTMGLHAEQYSGPVPTANAEVTKDGATYSVSADGLTITKKKLLTNGKYEVTIYTFASSVLVGNLPRLSSKTVYIYASKKAYEDDEEYESSVTTTFKPNITLNSTTSTTSANSPAGK